MLCRWCCKKKEIESKDHTGMYKKEGSLQNALVVGLIKTVHLEKNFVYWGATLRKSVSPYACSQNRSSNSCTAAFLGTVLGDIKLKVTVISADLVLFILWVFLILYSWNAVLTFAGFCQSEILTIFIVTVQSALSFGFWGTSFQLCSSTAVNIVYLRLSVWTLNVSFSLPHHSEPVILFLWKSLSVTSVTPPRFDDATSVIVLIVHEAFQQLLLTSHTSCLTIEPFKFDGLI